MTVAVKADYPKSAISGMLLVPAALVEIFTCNPTSSTIVLIVAFNLSLSRSAFP